MENPEKPPRERRRRDATLEIPGACRGGVTPGRPGDLLRGAPFFLDRLQGSIRITRLEVQRNGRRLVMAKKLGLAALLAVTMFTFSGCAAGGGDFFYRGWKHIEWHVLGAYKDLVQLHRDIDRYVFNLDDRDPDRY
jgi:hypothetical protein